MYILCFDVFGEKYFSIFTSMILNMLPATFNLFFSNIHFIMQEST